MIYTPPGKSIKYRRAARAAREEKMKIETEKKLGELEKKYHAALTAAEAAEEELFMALELAAHDGEITPEEYGNYLPPADPK
jgi:hypothetical protein